MTRKLFSMTVCALALGLAACGGSTASAGGSTGEGTAAVAATPAAMRHPALASIDLALGEPSVAVRADQKTKLAAVRSTLDASLAPIRAAHAELDEALAKSLEAGAVDTAAIDAAQAKLEAAEKAAVPAIQQAANDLHATLDATQRAALVDAMRAQFHDKMKDHKGGHREHLEKIANELGLTDAQRDAIKSAMHAKFGEMHKDGDHEKWGEMRTRMQAQVDAFKSDTYDAKALGVGEHPMMGGKGPFAARGRALVEVSIPVLTPAQRTQLAAKLRERAAKAD